MNIVLSVFGTSDDFVSDRLVRRYGVITFVFVALAMAIGLTRYDAISCWVPAHFTAKTSMISEKFCWSTATLHSYDTDDSHVTSRWKEFDDDTRRWQFDLKPVKYFPVFAVMLALLFLLPRAFWNASATLLPFNMTSLARAASVASSKADNSRDFDALASSVFGYLSNPLPVLSTCPLRGFVLSMLFLVTRFGYLLVCLLQFVFIGKFFSINFFSFHFEQSNWMEVNVTDNNTEIFYWEKEHFPKLVMCEFSVSSSMSIFRENL